MAEEVKGAENDLAAQLEAERQARLAVEDKLAITEVEKENYKTVALKRKGKLENDDNFFGDNDEADVEKVIGSKVAQTQKEREIARQIEIEKQARLKAESALAEVLRANDNKPTDGVGASSGGGQTVGDSIFSDAQVDALKQRWTIRGFSEEQQVRMLEQEKKNALARRQMI